MPEPRVGERVGGYEVIELVGSGGMGRVYRARQLRLERIVALKVIRPELAAEDSFRERFRREAQLAASVDHPNVIPVYEADEVDGVLFVAMRWVAGPDLRRVLAEGPLDPTAAVDVVRQVADALEAAHRIGLVHRDIKPANVLTEGARVYLSDFGLARSLAGADDVTATGGFVGTVDYAAPELLDGARAGPRADIYALGCLMFEALTGSVPYPVESLLGKLHAHSSEDAPAPSTVCPELPRALDPVVQKAMAKDPAQRFATAAELADAAERALRDGGAGEAAARPAQRRRRQALAAGAAVVAAAAAAVAIVLVPGGSPHQAAAAHVASTATTSSAVTTVASRALPSPASLPVCRRASTGAPRRCRIKKGGGVESLGSVGTPLKLVTMDVTVTHVAIVRSLRSPSGDVVTPPSGTRFIVLGTTFVNRTRSPQVFEPSSGTVAGRQTALWLFDRRGKIDAYHGPDFADYSVQDSPALQAISADAISGKKLQPNIPFDGKLVFAYPEKDLRPHPQAILELHEFGAGFGGRASVGGIRLRL